jgi:hypothetical protein
MIGIIFGLAFGYPLVIAVMMLIDKIIKGL